MHTYYNVALDGSDPTVDYLYHRSSFTVRPVASLLQENLDIIQSVHLLIMFFHSPLPFIYFSILDKLPRPTIRSFKIGIFIILYILEVVYQ